MKKEKSFSPYLKAYLHLEAAFVQLQEILPRVAVGIADEMDQVWLKLSDKEHEYLNNRSEEMKQKKYNIVLIGEPGSEELKVSEESLINDLEEFVKLDIKVNLLGKKGNVIRALCTDFAVQMLKDRWYTNSVDSAETTETNEQ